MRPLTIEAEFIKFRMGPETGFNILEGMGMVGPLSEIVRKRLFYWAEIIKKEFHNPKFFTCIIFLDM